MKINVDPQGTLVLRDVFSSVVFRTDEGNELIVCMRDGGFEIAARLMLDEAELFNDHGEFNHRPLYWYKADELGIRPLAKISKEPHKAVRQPVTFRAWKTEFFKELYSLLWTGK